METMVWVLGADAVVAAEKVAKADDSVKEREPWVFYVRYPCASHACRTEDQRA